MPIEKVNINPEILTWAKKSLNLDDSYIAGKFNKKEEDIRDWSNGRKRPTYKQLERLSYEILKIPLASFFLSQPPPEDYIERNFRSLPFFEEISYKTRIAIMRAQFLQESLLDLMGANHSDNPIFKKLQFDLDKDVLEYSKRVRKDLGITFAIQKSFDNFYAAFNYYREKIEDFGIFTFQLKLEGDRAFCLNDSEFPIIVLNSGDTPSSKIFSLFHELAHLLLNSNNVFHDGGELNYNYPFDTTEIFCNQFASEVLVPSDDILSRYDFPDFIDEEDELFMSKIAKDYYVSREVILRKTKNLGFTNNQVYEKLKTKWDSERKKKKGGGNYYSNLISSLGKNYIFSILENHRKGRINDSRALELLNIKMDKMLKLESKLYS